MPYLLAPDRLLQALTAEIAVQNNIQVRASNVTSTQSRQIGDWHNLYPWIDGGVALALGESGLNPRSNQARQIALAAADQRLASPLGTRPAGSVQIGQSAPRPDISTWSQSAEQADLPATFQAGEFEVSPEDDPEAWFARMEQDVPFLSDKANKRRKNNLARIRQDFDSGLSFRDALEKHGALDTTDPIWSAIKRSAQVGFSALDFFPQLPNELFRTVSGDIRKGDILNLAQGAANPFSAVARSAPRTDIGMITSQIVKGEELDLGQGFFIPEDSNIRREQYRRQFEASGGTIDGHLPTIGRGIASVIPGVEPDSWWYDKASGLIDGAIFLASDPLNYVTLGSASSRHAVRGGKLISKKFFTEAGRLEEAAELSNNAKRGLFRGMSKSRDDRTFANWLTNNPEGQALIDKLDSETDFYNIWFGTMSKNGIPALSPRTALRIADTAPGNRDEVLRAVFEDLKLTPAVGEPVAYKRPWKINKPVVQRLKPVPSEVIDLGDDAMALQQLDLVLNNVNASPDLIRSSVRRMAEAPTIRDRRRIMNQTRFTALTEQGLDEEIARRFIRAHDDLDESMDAFDVARHADPDNPIYEYPGFFEDVAVQGLRRNESYGEMFNRYYHYPSARDERRLVSTMKKLQPAMHELFADPITGQMKPPFSFLMAMGHDLWKTPQLALRPIAWMMREGIDEFGRQAILGFSMGVRHPLQYAMGVMGGMRGTLDDAFKETHQFQKLVGSGTRGLVGHPQDAIRVGGMRKYTKGTVRSRLTRRDLPVDEFYFHAATEEIGKLTSNPIANHLAKFGDPQSTIDELWEGSLRPVLDDLAHFEPNLAQSKSALAEHVNGVVLKRVQHITGGNEDLLKLIADGKLTVPDKLRGTRSIFPLSPETNRIDPEFLRRIQKFKDSLPEELAGPSFAPRGAAATRRMDRSMDWLMAHAMTFEEIAIRQPVWRSAWWENAPKVMPFMTRQAQESFIQMAESAGKTLPKGIRKQMDQAFSKGAVGEMDFDLAKQALHGKAAGVFRNTLYDFAQRSRFFDTIRLLTPFGNAWKEFFSRWGRLIATRPVAPALVHRGLESGFDSGLFYEDEHGEIVFAMPGLDYLAEHVIDRIPVVGGSLAESLDKGIAVPFTGRVQGLNMGLELIPGSGPLVTFAMDAILEGNPRWDKAREIFAPYGSERSPIDFFLPSYLSKLVTAGTAENAPALLRRTLEFMGADTPERRAQWSSAVAHEMNLLASTGEYAHTPDDRTRLINDARRRATGFIVNRALFQAVTPTAPKPNWFLIDKDGEHVMEAALQEDLQSKYDEEPRTARERFIDEWGMDMWGILVSPVVSEEVVAPGVTKEADRWLRENGDIRSAFPRVAGLFAPAGGEWDFEAAARATRRGEGRFRTEQEYARAGADVLGRMMFNKLTDAAGASPNSAQRGLLAQAREELVKVFDGYEPKRWENMVPGWISDIENALATKPELQETEAGQAASLYLRLRSAAMTAAVNAGLQAPGFGFATANRMREVRDALRLGGAELVRAYPGFEPMWLRVFQRELKLDEDE